LRQQLLNRDLQVRQHPPLRLQRAP